MVVRETVKALGPIAYFFPASLSLPQLRPLTRSGRQAGLQCLLGYRSSLFLTEKQHIHCTLKAKSSQAAALTLRLLSVAQLGRAGPVL